MRKRKRQKATLAAWRYNRNTMTTLRTRGRDGSFLVHPQLNKRPALFYPLLSPLLVSWHGTWTVQVQYSNTVLYVQTYCALTVGTVSFRPHHVPSEHWEQSRETRKTLATCSIAHPVGYDISTFRFDIRERGHPVVFSCFRTKPGQRVPLERRRQRQGFR